MADNKVTIEIAVEGNAQLQFKKLSDSAAEFASETNKSFLDTGRIFDNFIANLGSSAVSSALGVIKSGFAAFNDLLYDSIAAASEQEDAINQLNTALKSTGQFSNEASAELQEFANSIQATTKFSDEAVLSASALIASIGKLGKDDIKAATQAAIDLSAALGVDLQTAAQKVAQAAEGQSIKIKGFKIEADAAKSTSENFAIALEKIQKFSGSAEAQTNTFSGAIAKLKNSFGESLESIGNLIIKSPELIVFIKELGKEFLVLSEWISTNSDEIRSLIRDGLIILGRSLGFIANVADIVVRAFQFVVGAIEAVLGSILKLTTGSQLLATLTGKSNELNDALSKLSSDGVNRVKNSFVGESWLENVGQSLANITQRTIDATKATSDYNDKVKEGADNSKGASNDELERKAFEAEQKAIQQEQSQANELLSLQSYLTQKNEFLQKFDNDASAKKIAKNNETLKKVNDAIEKSDAAQIEQRKRLNKEKEDLDKEEAKNRLDTINFIATMSTAKTKELAVIGKAAALSAATISTYEAANKALAAFPPPFSFLAAAATVAAGLVNVSNIVGTPLATGITQVPAGFQNDTFPARLTSGERVVSAPQNKDLTDFLAGSSGLTAKLDQLIYVLSLDRSQSIMIDGREILTAVQSQVDSGRALNV